MTDHVGTLLWEWRAVVGWSLGQLARRAGVAKSTLSQWEAGLRQPRMPELEAALTALGVTPSQRTRALACVQAPRAIRVLSAASPVSPLGPLPTAGDLLRAMRMRAGWTQAQLALHLGVRQNTVARWELGERRPSTEQMQALCFALRAHAGELVALTTGAFGDSPVPVPTDLVAARHYANDLLYDPRAELVDLRFLLLERTLWRRTAEDERARPVLATAYANHAHYLSLYGRWEEVRVLAARAIALTPREGPVLTYTLRAALKLAAAEVYGGIRQSPQRGVRRLNFWLAYSSHRDYTAWMLSDMGRYLAMSGQHDAALELGRRAVAVTEQEQEMRQLDYGRLLVMAGRPAEALDRLPTLPQSGEGIFVYEALVRCEAFLTLGQRDEASAWLQRAYVAMDAAGLRYDRAQADALASRLGPPTS